MVVTLWMGLGGGGRPWVLGTLIDEGDKFEVGVRLV